MTAPNRAALNSGDSGLTDGQSKRRKPVTSERRVLARDSRYAARSGVDRRFASAMASMPTLSWAGECGRRVLPRFDVNE